MMRFAFLVTAALCATLSANASADSASFEDQFFIGFYSSIVSSDAGKAIPQELSSNFARCYAKVVSSYVSPEHRKAAEDQFAKGQQPTAELQAAVTSDILGEAAKVLAQGSDPIGDACPDTAKAYRAYLRS